VAKAKQYVYIVQSSKETNVCKIGITDNFQRRLKEYNNMTGKSKDTVFKYLFVCEVKDMNKVENAIKKEFSTNRTEKNKEIYLYNEPWFNIYVDFIKRSQLYIKEVLIKEDNKKTVTKIVKRNTPTLEERGIRGFKDLLQKSKKVKNDEFYTRYEDIELELNMYDSKIWENKTVFCNCDDAYGGNENNSSAFTIFFLRNFKI
jgi:predicted GIY-YIG superfamily endonuclease